MLSSSRQQHRAMARKRQDAIVWASVASASYEAPEASTSAVTLDTYQATQGKVASGKTRLVGPSQGRTAVAQQPATIVVQPSSAAATSVADIGKGSVVFVAPSPSTVVRVSTSERVSVSVVTSYRAPASASITPSNARPTPAPSRSVDPSLAAAASAWESYLRASSAEARKIAASIASESAWLNGPSGRASRLSVSYESALAAASSAAVFSADGAIKLRASSLAALGTGQPLTLAPTHVFNPSSMIKIAPSQSAGAGDDGTASESGAGQFFQSLGKTPASIALTVLVCVAIAAVTLAALAFVGRRWCVRRRKRDLSRYPMFADDASDYAQDEKFAEPDNDRWSVHSVFRRHSGDAAMDQGVQGRWPSDDYEDAASMRTVSMPRSLPPLPMPAPHQAFAMPTHQRMASEATLPADAYSGIRAFMGMPAAVTASPAPSLPYLPSVGPSPVPVLPPGARAGNRSAMPRSRFSSFSTVAPGQLAGVERSYTTHSDYSASSYQGTAAPGEEEDEDEEETATEGNPFEDGEEDEEDTEREGEDDEDAVSETSSFQPDRVDKFRHRLSLAGSEKAESVHHALRARRQSVTGEAL